MYAYKEGDNWLSSSATERDLGVIVDHKLK